YGEKAKTLAEKLNYQRGVGYALKNIGLANQRQGNYVNALNSWEQSLKVFDEINFKKGIANLQQNLGTIYFDQSDDEKALDHFLKALKVAEEINDTLRIAENLTNVGAIYGKKKATYDKAIEYDLRALTYNEAVGNLDAVGTVTSNIGEIYFLKGDDTTALRYFERSLKAYEEDNSEWVPYPLNFIGRVYTRRGDYTNAIKYHSRAYEFAAKLDAKLDMAQSLLWLAAAYAGKKDFKQAITTYLESEKLADEISANEELKNIYEGLSLAYSQMHDYGKAFKYQTLLIRIKDVIYNLETDKKLGTLQFTFDLEKKENQINLLTKDKEIQEQEIKRQRLVRNSFIGGFAIVLLFAGVFFTQRNRISKEKKRSDELLLNILPEETAEELKATGTAKAKSFDLVSVLFTDFKNFTQASEKLSPEELVEEINHCYSEFDRIITKYGVEKIKTIGDAYMCAGGLPVTNRTHPVDVVKAGLEMQQFIAKNKKEREEKGLPFFELRLGIHTGPVVAGIVGIKKFAYDIWGDTVNTASRMESSGEIGKVNISGATYELVKDKFNCIHRGKIKAKNKGEIDMYFVEPA
ncbi:MAG: adenylate/guanylate cyclase domain-containing protein, partial [Bacteroidia bacterium]